MGVAEGSEAEERGTRIEGCAKDTEGGYRVACNEGAVAPLRDPVSEPMR